MVFVDRFGRWIQQPYPGDWMTCLDLGEQAASCPNRLVSDGPITCFHQGKFVVKNYLRNVFVAIAIASASALVAGCGGGDSSRDALMDLETEFAAEQERVAALEAELAEALAAAQTAAAAASTKIEGLEMAQSEAAQEFTAAQTEAEETLAAERLKVTNLQSDLQTAQSDLETAQTEYEMVVEEKEEAEKLASDRAIALANQAGALGIMIADYKGQVNSLQIRLDAAQGALATAETERDAAVTARIDAEQLAETEQSTVQAQLVAARQDIIRLQDQLRTVQAQLDRADDDREQIADERDDAVDRADRAAAQDVFTGLGTASSMMLAVTPRYRDHALLVTPALTSASGSQAGQWYRTTATGRRPTANDWIEVYSNVEAPEPIPFKDSEYNEDDLVVDAQGDVVGWFDVVSVSNGGPLRDDAASGSFDRASDTPKSFDLVDRGPTQMEWDDARAAKKIIDDINSDDNDINDEPPYDTSNPDYRLRVRDLDRYPERYSVDRRGTLGGASGTFRCEHTDKTTECTVQNRGSSFNFVGPWEFRPLSATVTVRVPDENYMWFGWWARQNPTDDTWVFDADHGPTGSRVSVSDVTAVTGPATYTGAAIGRYAVRDTIGTQPEQGQFTATAVLVADFGTATEAGTLRGTISEFSNNNEWLVTLQSASITSITADTTWAIGELTADTEDGWNAAFYSNLPADDREGVVPHGVAGTFEAEHPMVARMIGAFGAER